MYGLNHASPLKFDEATRGTRGDLPLGIEPEPVCSEGDPQLR